MPTKIAVIGAGSIGFTRRLFRDLLSVEELRDVHFAFTDINKQNLNMTNALCQKDIKNNPSVAKKVKITSSIDRRKALENADYIVNLVRIGGLEAFKQDVEIPLKYGVDQCVGDTLCAGGLMYAQRGINFILDLCKDIKECAKPDALLMNYSNPMSMLTWAAIDYGKVNTIGLCHGIEHGWDLIAKAFNVSKNQVNGICAGINHISWYLKIKINNSKITSEQLLKALESHPEYSKTEKCRIDILRRIGYFTTESNGHISEYLPWYRKRSEEIPKWISLDSWINGETAGYLRTCIESRNWFETDFDQWLSAKDEPISSEERSNERGSYIIESIETGRLSHTYANVKNNGIISNLPNDCIVEVPVYIDKDGIHPALIGSIPYPCAATCSAAVNVQRMGKEAAVHGDLTLLKQAFMHDALIGAVCNTEEIWAMVDEMVMAQKEWLPQYAKHLPYISSQLKTSVNLTRRSYDCKTRLEIRSIEKLRNEYTTLEMDAGKRDSIKTFKAPIKMN